MLSYSQIPMTNVLLLTIYSQAYHQKGISHFPLKFRPHLPTLLSSLEQSSILGHRNLLVHLSLYSWSNWDSLKLVNTPKPMDARIIFETLRSINTKSELHSQVACKAEVQASLKLRAGTVLGHPLQARLRTDSKLL